jgi:hypothetical protein
MVVLYVAGERVGTLAEAETLIPEFVAKNQKVEFRDDAGNSLGMFTPTPVRDPNEPLVPWDPSITREDLERIKAEPGFPFEEVKKQLGWE